MKNKDLIQTLQTRYASVHVHFYIFSCQQCVSCKFSGQVHMRSVHVHFYTFGCNSVHSIQRFVALVILQYALCELLRPGTVITPCYLTVLHNVVNPATIGVIGLEYPTHCCTHSPNVCRMTWTASCWLVPMGGWGLCRSW